MFVWKEKYFAHIKPLKQTWDQGLVLQKLHIVIKFNEET